MQKQNKESELSQEVEKIMDHIDTGKIKTKKHSVDEFLKFVDKAVSE